MNEENVSKDESDEESDEKEESEDDSEDEEKNKAANKPISDKEYFETLKSKSEGDKKIKEKKKKEFTKLLTVKVRGLAYNHKKKDVKRFFQGMKPKSIRVPPKIKGIAYVGFKTEKYLNQALEKDKTFLGKLNCINYNQI